MKSKFDIAIVGGGPAGLTSAIYSLRSGFTVVLFEKNVIGGQAAITPSVENYPGFETIGGFDLTWKMFEQASALGLVTNYDEIVSIEQKEQFVLKTVSEDVLSNSVILATGARPRKLGFEEEYIGRGVSYCATCDGNFYKNKAVAVVGGGNTALEDALYLANIASKVYLVHRRNEFRGEEILAQQVKANKKIELVLSAKVVSLVGEDFLTSAVVEVEGQTKKLEIDGLFVAVGNVPQTEFLSGLLKLDSQGYVLSDESMTTTFEGLFVAGDMRKKELRQIVTACSDGAIAANHAGVYLRSLK